MLKMALTLNLHFGRTSPYRPDLFIFLVSVPLIAAFNYYLMHPEDVFNRFLALDYTIDTLQGYLAVLGIRQSVLFLDRKYPFEARPQKRLIFQLIGSTLLGLLIICLLTELTSLVLDGRWKPLRFYTFNIWIVAIWALMVSAIYALLHFYHAWKQAGAASLPGQPETPPGIMARAGNKQLRIPFDEIVGFSVDGNYAVCHNREGTRYYLDQSLAELEATVPSGQFFRLNRQYILRHNYVHGYNRAENGKVIALLKDQGAFPKEITISRTKAPTFKRWLRSA